MQESAEYLIVQWIPNILRHEPKNVGVIVLSPNGPAARFYGENGHPGKIHKTIAKKITHHDIYSQWVTYWREQLRTGNGSLKESLTQSRGGDYEVIFGGSVEDIGQDSAKDVCDYLFGLLVDEPQEAKESEVEEDSDIKDRGSEALVKNITSALKKIDVLASNVHVPHPVKIGAIIGGKQAAHQPTYSQSAQGTLFVMESVSFRTSNRNLSRNRAFYAAKMFEDICNSNASSAPIAMVYATEADLADPKVQYPMGFLKETSTVVNWMIPEQRREWLNDRKKYAYESPFSQR